jgi:predicted RNase H-like HicB family nuclease
LIENLILHFILEEAEEGGYVIYVPSLLGCVSQGESKEEAVENIKRPLKSLGQKGRQS